MTFRTLRLQLRFLLPLVATLVVAAYLAVPLLDQMTLRWFSRDLSSRGVLVANALSDSTSQALQHGDAVRLRPLFDRAVQDERLVAIGLCDAHGVLLQSTAAFPGFLTCPAAVALSQLAAPRLAIDGGAVHVGVHDGRRARRAADAASPPVLLGRIVLLQDLSFIDRRSQDSRHYLIGLIMVLGLVIAFITVVVAQLSWRGWLAGARALMRGEGLLSPMLPSPELAPLAADLRVRLRDLEDEYRRAQGAQADWNSERLRTLLRTQLSGDQVIVVSNREPYIHEHGESGVVVKRPASGLVTAVEPVMRACSGTWWRMAGGADRDGVDAADRVLVPPRQDDYWLRRIWLTAEEEQGYYYGFANEACGRCATWPMCGRSSASRTGRPSAPSTSALPTRWWPRRAARTR